MGKFTPAKRHFVLAATPPADDYAPSESHWVERGVDRLYVGELIRIRQGDRVLKGAGSHGQRIWGKTVRPDGREITERVETTTYAVITRIGQKRGVPTAYYRVVSTDSGRTSPSGALGIPAVLTDNAAQVGKRQREVRRLAGSGPTAEEREAMDPETHSREARRLEFAGLLDATREAGGYDDLLHGDPYREDTTPVTDERFEGWRAGDYEPPAWAFSVLRRLKIADENFVAEAAEDPGEIELHGESSVADMDTLSVDEDPDDDPVTARLDEAVYDPGYTIDPDAEGDDDHYGIAAE
ncbi:MAG TPA: hypothetical protein ENH55_01375 [Aurantimonas coralicida]|uniref:Uncharacterized protein n=2 Tax=root TaxID=1 RepID=A0A9C9NGP8_9HYPH|nr:hypothetical protein [Aurantimonas coralicida]HEU01227.1 hypothetical protein [Aurantimonas coralicida]